MTISPPSGRQIAAARALLGLSPGQVAAAARVAVEDVAKAEAGVDGAATTALRAALEAAGIEFIDGGAPGVRLRPTAQGLRADQLNASNDD
ncbi:transcriptional regulator [Aquabacter sp. CN5-332]|uniref:transcriptional regulator n=1 Tax=Aquabacter sp. CN5-332 TaxID=3156608 RepID=UPI0032B47BD7